MLARLTEAKGDDITGLFEVEIEGALPFRALGDRKQQAEQQEAAGGD